MYIVKSLRIGYLKCLDDMFPREGEDVAGSLQCVSVICCLSMYVSYCTPYRLCYVHVHVMPAVFVIVYV